MDRTGLQRWIERYERLWRTAGTDALGDLFAAHATYLPSPWAQPVTGLEAIVRFWGDERDGPGEQFTMTSHILAVDGDTGVVRVEVRYGTGETWRDLWIVRFDADGRCASFEEWPFAPDQSDGHPPTP